MSWDRVFQIVNGKAAFQLRLTKGKTGIQLIEEAVWGNLLEDTWTEVKSAHLVHYLWLIPLAVAGLPTIVLFVVAHLIAKRPESR